jgi:hypothetical protein
MDAYDYDDAQPSCLTTTRSFNTDRHSIGRFLDIGG